MVQYNVEIFRKFLKENSSLCGLVIFASLLRNIENQAIIDRLANDISKVLKNSH